MELGRGVYQRASATGATSSAEGDELTGSGVAVFHSVFGGVA